MKGLGVLLVVVAIILLAIGATMDIGIRGVANLSLMNTRTNLFIVGGLALVGGLLLVAVAGNRKPSEETSSKPATSLQPFAGTKDLSLASYKEFLIERYRIRRNDVLAEFILGEKTFPDVGLALEEAHRMYEEELVELARPKPTPESVANVNIPPEIAKLMNRGPNSPSH